MSLSVTDILFGSDFRLADHYTTSDLFILNSQLFLKTTVSVRKPVRQKSLKITTSKSEIKVFIEYLVNFFVLIFRNTAFQRKSKKNTKRSF